MGNLSELILQQLGELFKLVFEKSSENYSNETIPFQIGYSGNLQAQLDLSSNTEHFTGVGSSKLSFVNLGFIEFTSSSNWHACRHIWLSSST